MVRRSSDSKTSCAACRANTLTNARRASSHRASIGSVAPRRTTGGLRRPRLRPLRSRSAMIRLPMLNVDSWFAGVRCGDDGRHRVRLRTRCCCSRARKVYSAQRSRVMMVSAIDSICRNQDAVGTNPRASFRSAPHRAMWRRARCFEHTPRRDCCQRRFKPRPSRICRLSGAQCGVNARRPCGTHGRSVAESVDAAEHRMKIQNAVGE